MKRSIELGDVQKTLLIPLYGRAIETRNGGGLLCDPKAVAMVEAIDYDFLQFADEATVKSCVLRTAIFDEWVRGFLAVHPDGTVIEIGAGLNTRFERLDNGRLRWVDLDLPDSMLLRRQFFVDSARRKSVAGSVLDEAWADIARTNPGPYFLVAEGVFVYLREEEVKRALALIAHRFPDASVAFDTADHTALKALREQNIKTEIKARLNWSCDDPRDVEQWDLGYSLVESRSLVDLPVLLERRLPFSYRYWTALARLLRRKEVDAYRMNLYRVQKRLRSPRGDPSEFQSG